MTSIDQIPILGRRQTLDRAYPMRLFALSDVTYMLTALLLFCMRLLSPERRVRVIQRLSALLSRLFYVVNSRLTIKICEHVETILGPERTPEAVEADVRRVQYTILWNTLALHSLSVLPAEQVAELVPVEGLSPLDKDLDGTRPVLIWSYHFGVHPLIVAAILRARGYPVHVVAHAHYIPAPVTRFQRFYWERVVPIGELLSLIDLYEPTNRGMSDVLRRGECLCAPPDDMMPAVEEPSDPAMTTPVDFLGRRVYLPVGTLRLAKQFQARVVVVTTSEQDAGGLRLAMEPFELPTSGWAADQLQQDLQSSMDRLEVQVKTAPYLWFDLGRDDLLKRIKLAEES